MSIAPFVIGVLRYAVDVDKGRPGAPEDIVLRDRVLQLVGLAWLATFLATVAIRDVLIRTVLSPGMPGSEAPHRVQCR